MKTSLPPSVLISRIIAEFTSTPAEPCDCSSLFTGRRSVAVGAGFAETARPHGTWPWREFQLQLVNYCVVPYQKNFHFIANQRRIVWARPTRPLPVNKPIYDACNMASGWQISFQPLICYQGANTRTTLIRRKTDNKLLAPTSVLVVGDCRVRHDNII